MINFWVALSFIVWHWFADFVMQNGEDAKNKSHDLIALIRHTTTYSLLWFPIIVLLGSNGVIFIGITFILHTLTDYFTSKHTSKQYAKGNFGGEAPRGMDFFVTIGFDQVLHYVQLFSTYYLLA
jgi:hypothetical protein